MKKVLIIVGVVIAVLVIAIIAVPFAIPTETYQSQIESRVSAATGRELRINGPVRLSLFPAVAVVANDVTFANAAGGRDTSMATLDKLDVHVSVLPLLSGNVQISRLVLEKPVIHLEVDRQGKANWDFAAATANAIPAQTPQNQNRPPPSASSGGPSDIVLGDVRLSDGTVTYTDDRSGARYEISAINATVKLPNLDSPLAADGSLVWNNEKLSLTANASSPRGLMTGKGSDVAVKLDSKPVAIAFTGHGEGTPLKLTGELDLGTPSVRNLAQWAGQPLQVPGNGLGPLSIKGTLAAAPQHVSFTKASYKLDAIEASGDLAVDTSGRVPAIKAALATNVLDLNPYLPPEQKASPQGQPQPRSPAQTAQSGWSTDPIDVSGLRAANADLALTTAGLVVRKIKVGKSALHVTLDDGKLTSDLTEMALYDGNGKARVTVDGSGRVPAVAMTFNIDGVQAQPLLKDAMDMDRVSGAAVADGSVSGSGASQRDLISALNGKGSLKLRNGKIRGLDIGSMVKNIGSAFSSSDNQQTEFAEASATYTITNGIVRNDDLAMNAPLFDVTGKGTVDLPKRTVDYRVVPKVGVGVPIIVSGAWDNISYRPDLASAIPDAQQSIRGLRDMFRGGGSPPQGQGAPAQGQGQSTPQQQPQQQQKSNPLDRLNNLLGR